MPRTVLVDPMSMVPRMSYASQSAISSYTRGSIEKQRTIVVPRSQAKKSDQLWSIVNINGKAGSEASPRL
jgi:hypothetical protein